MEHLEYQEGRTELDTLGEFALIERLTDEEKTIIFLYIDRHKTGQIAQAIGKSESAVRQIISRTKIKLRMLYEKERENDR